mmetsp:Transcript_21161/g.67429  ORF Transcript_21161/g.67429 Transcript_21161/m.67429 type:complete len:255 (+) Transcript_21161:696-1460(+)
MTRRASGGRHRGSRPQKVLQLEAAHLEHLECSRRPRSFSFSLSLSRPRKRTPCLSVQTSRGSTFCRARASTSSAPPPRASREPCVPAKETMNGFHFGIAYVIAFVVYCTITMLVAWRVFVEKDGWGVGWFFATVFIFVAPIASIVARVCKPPFANDVCWAIWVSAVLAFATFVAPIVAAFCCSLVDPQHNMYSDNSCGVFLWMMFASAPAALVVLIASLFSICVLVPLVKRVWNHLQGRPDPALYGHVRTAHAV